MDPQTTQPLPEPAPTQPPQKSPPKTLFIVIGGVVFLLLLSIGSVLLIQNTSVLKPTIAPTFTPAPATPTPTIPIKTEYSNPFDEKSSYENPFEASDDYQNPFDTGQ